MGSVLDPKWTGRPKTYDGDKKNWRKFATSLKGYVGAICPELLAMMKIAQTLRDPVPNHYLNQVQRQYDAALYYILTNLTEGDATDLMDGVDEGEGLEAWRIMAKPSERNTVVTNRKRFQRILDPVHIKGTFAQRTSKWEKEMRDYTRITNKEIDEETKLGVLEAKLAPDSIKEHLSLHGDKYETYKGMKDKVEQFLLDKEDDETDAMDVNAVSEVNAVYDPHGKGAKGRGKGRGGYGKSNKETQNASYVPWWEKWQQWNNQQGGGKKGGKSKGAGKPAKGAGKGGKTQRFDGYCDHCWKHGHKKKDCSIFQRTDEYAKLKEKWDKQKAVRKDKNKEGDSMDVGHIDGAEVALPDDDGEATWIFAVEGAESDDDEFSEFLERIGRRPGPRGSDTTATTSKSSKSARQKSTRIENGAVH